MDGADLRWVFLLSLAAVGLTSILAARSESFASLLVARALQGLLAAVYVAVYMPVISIAVPAGQRGRAISVIASIMMLGSVALAPLGGWVAEIWGWRAVFLVKLPLPTCGSLANRRGRIGLATHAYLITTRPQKNRVPPVLLEVCGRFL